MSISACNRVTLCFAPKSAAPDDEDEEFAGVDVLIDDGPGAAADGGSGAEERRPADA